MDTRENIKRYMAKTKISRESRSRYSMNIEEAFAFRRASEENPMDAILLAFDYGLAKGYRAAKSEVTR